MKRRGSRAQSGSVTAEAALVLPVMAAFVVMLVWMLSVAVAQVRAVDAVRDAARALARGDDQVEVLADAQETAPDGARLEVARDGDQVTVTVSFHASPPGGLLVSLPGAELTASSTVQVEDNGDASP